MNYFYLVPFASLFALGFALYFFKKMMREGEGTERMKTIAQFVREGAMSYLKQQYKVVAIVFVILSIIFGVMAHFVTRKAMNIAIGPETISLLYDKGLVKDPADLYELKFEDLIHLERWAETSARNLLASIEKSKSVPYERVLYALGIRYVGETVAQKLAQAFPSIDLLAQATFEQLTSVEEIGDRIARSVIDSFTNPKFVDLVDRLRRHGLQFSLTEEALAAKTDKLKGKNIVISGTFELHSRDEYKAMILQNGGKNSGSVSKNTDFILAGENMGPAKLEKAKKLGVKIIDEKTFLSMIGQT